MSSRCGSTGRVLVALAVVHAVALYLFTTGFFLTRFEVPDVSQCRVRPHETAAATHLRSHEELHDHDNDNGGCWMPRRFRRVVFVVIDALRFDFVLPPSSSASSSSSSSPSSSSPSFFLNHLPILNATLTAQPEHSALFKFVADPPTMTMQRLKGLTTGSLPTFLDIKDNMASSAITEDNLIQQMHAARRPIVCMGDDTWDALYTSQFTRKYAFDSFNVKDLHTVDRGVVRHLFPELRASDWDLLIAHFLGVDHVGHTHGPSSPFMTEKLREMNGVLTQLLDALPDEDTLLLVLGDHGMSADGNHGGASDDETGAALFLYSKQPLVNGGDVHETLGGAFVANEQRRRSVPQVDLVPTIALLSGLPIPFGNLGAVIPELFLYTTTTDNSSLARLTTLNDALRLNVDQVRRYLFTYSSASKLPESEYDGLEQLHAAIVALERRVETATAEQEDDVVVVHLRRDLATKQHAYVREALSLGRSIWTQFDLVSMGCGIVLLLVGLALVTIELIAEQSTLSLRRMGAVGTMGFCIGCIVPTTTASALLLPRAWLSRGAFLGCMAASIDMLVGRGTLCSRSTARSLWASRNSTWLVAFAMVLLHVLTLLSNSYIVAEDRVMHFLSTSVGLYALWYCQRVASPQRKRVGVMSAALCILATRLVSTIEPPNIIQSTTTWARTWLPLLAISVTAIVLALPSFHARLRLRLVECSLVLFNCNATALYWYLAPIDAAWLRLWLPRSVFVVALGAITSSVALRRTSWSPPSPMFLVLVVLPAFALVLGPMAPLTTLTIALQSLSLVLAVHASNTTHHVVPWTLLACTLAYHSFFTSGHQNTFTSLQNAAGFVGFDEFHFYWAGALLAFNTFGGYLVTIIPSIALLTLDASRSRACLSAVAYFALHATVSTIFVALQRRHLMVWAIFAPKFIFDGATLLVIDLLVIVASLQ